MRGRGRGQGGGRIRIGRAYAARRTAEVNVQQQTLLVQMALLRGLEHLRVVACVVRLLKGQQLLVKCLAACSHAASLPPPPALGPSRYASSGHLPCR